MTFLISFSVNVIFDKNLWVLPYRTDGSALPLSVSEYYLAKKELNNSAFSLKLVTNLFSRKIGRMHNFYYYGKNFSTDQYVSVLVDGSIHFSINESDISV